MNRRQFLTRFAAPIVAVAAIPELARTIILPPRGGWPTRDMWRRDFANGVMVVNPREGYDHIRYAMSFEIVDDGPIEAQHDFTHITRYVKRERYSNRLLTSSELQAALVRDMEDWRNLYYGTGA